MATPPNKRKESPVEPLKRVLGPALRAIAGQPDVEVGFGPGKPEVSGHSVQLPEPPRAPSPKDIAILRGWADSVALSMGCHDNKVHRKIVPPPGPRAPCSKRQRRRAWKRSVPTA